MRGVPVNSGIWNAPIPQGALSLAQQIPDLLNAAFAPKTLTKYGRAWENFKIGVKVYTLKKPVQHQTGLPHVVTCMF